MISVALKSLIGCFLVLIIMAFVGPVLDGRDDPGMGAG